MNKVSITTDEFKRRATQMHKGVYDYSTTVYISYLKKVEIGCRKDDHGRFWQKAGDHFGGEKAFKKLKENDILKNKYCEQRGVNLLRIPYYDIRKIPSILDTKLKTLEAA